MSDRCGYAVTDRDGNEEPCDRPATGWRWYQDVGEHEDLLDVACDLHANEGGRRIHAAEAALARVLALVRKWESTPGNASDFDYGRWHRAGANAVRSALTDPEETR
jgi:hypothetical protein